MWPAGTRPVLRLPTGAWTRRVHVAPVCMPRAVSIAGLRLAGCTPEGPAAPLTLPHARLRPARGAQSVLADAAIYWLSTVREDGRPHTTPLIAVWTGGAVHMCTGPDEQKAKNLSGNAHVIVMTGNNRWDGLDVIVEARRAG